MRCVIDTEMNSLNSPTQCWAIVCKDIDTNLIYKFRNVTSDEQQRLLFEAFYNSVDVWIGHNILEYDFPNLNRLIGLRYPDVTKCFDTLILSRLSNYSRAEGHSIEAYGREFGLEKIKFNDWTKWSQELEDYCVRDVEICNKIYDSLHRYISSPDNASAIVLEHRFQSLVNDLHSNGFSFNRKAGGSLLSRVTEDLAVLDKEILKAFPPKLKLVREITPTVTKHGTLHRKDFRWVTDGDLSSFNGGPFCLCSWVPFNPASHKQIIGVLDTAGWRPTDKTTTHIQTERELRHLKYRPKEKQLDIDKLYDKLLELKKFGWKINETNLATLPDSAPSPARTLAKRILLESRRRTLTEWLGLVQDDNRIHGKFYGIGAWTHRMAHQQPNTANIPSPTNMDGSTKLLGKELRSLWQAPRNRLLVGVDAEGIQLRIFAHYIDDKEFTDALVQGRKANRSDPHSLNKRVLGDVCKTRAAAKRFIYALLLGAGIPKLAQILEASEHETRSALDRLMDRYTGFARLKNTIIPADARRGWFSGLDGRAVLLPGDTPGERKHLCMSGYLQNGEAIIMKKAALLWHEQLKKEEDLGRWLFVNMVHDEWQTEVSNSMDKALRIAKIQSDSLRIVGEELKLKCPLAGSYYNDEARDYTVGTDWSQTH